MSRGRAWTSPRVGARRGETPVASDLAARRDGSDNDHCRSRTGTGGRDIERCSYPAVGPGHPRGGHRHHEIEERKHWDGNTGPIVTNRN